MTMGFAGIREASQDIERRKASGGGEFDRRLKIGSGEIVTVRFLEQDDDVAWCWTHQMPPIGNQSFGELLPCLDQRGKGDTDCPACRADGDVSKRRFQGYISVIWRDAPVFAEDNGRIDRASVVDHRDQIAYWAKGITTFEDLDALDTNYKGLMSRDFKVARKGSGLETNYTIMPADPDGGPQPMSQADKELAKEKYDMRKYITPLEFDEMVKRCRAQSQGSTSNGGGQSSASADLNPFLA